MKSLIKKVRGEKRIKNKIYPEEIINDIPRPVLKKMKRPSPKYKTKPKKLFISVFDFLAGIIGKYFILSLESLQEEEKMQDSLEEIYFKHYGYKKFVRSLDDSPIDIAENERGRTKMVLDIYTKKIGTNILSSLYRDYSKKSYMHDIKKTVEVLLSDDFFKYMQDISEEIYEKDFIKFLDKERYIIAEQIEEMLKQTKEKIIKDKEYFEKIE